MPTFSNTPRPAYVYEAATDQWIPVGFGPHTHAVTDVTNAFNTTTVTAKGDLVVAAGSNSVTKLPVGSNGQTLVPDSSTTTGLRWQDTFAAGKNKIINGDFYWNQRAFTSSTAGGVFFADRWETTMFSGTTTFTTPAIAYGSFPGQTSNKALRITSGSSSNDAGIRHKIEDVSTFAGQTITVSFWARSSGTTYGVDLVEALQQFGSGGSANVYIYADVTGKSYGSSWTRLSFQIAIPSVVGKTIGAGNHLSIRIDPVNTLASGEWIEITHVQVEAGSIATAFQTATGTIQGELAACQRYYSRSIADNSNTYAPFAQGVSTGGTTANIYFTFPVPMRVNPTSVGQSNLCISDLITYNLAITAIAINQATTRMVAFDVTTGTGATQFRPAFIRSNNSAAGYLEVSAEL